MRIAVLLLIITAGPLVARVNFKREVQPILETHCVRCHGDGLAMKGLRVDKRERAMMAIVKKKPNESRVYLAAKSGYMPPGPHKLKPEELEVLRRWIQEGARWPKNLELKAKPVPVD